MKKRRDWAEILMWFPRLVVLATLVMWAFAYYRLVEGMSD